jgi:hypothetical protein
MLSYPADITAELDVTRSLTQMVPLVTWVQEQEVIRALCKYLVSVMRLPAPLVLAVLQETSARLLFAVRDVLRPLPCRGDKPAANPRTHTHPPSC